MDKREILLQTIEDYYAQKAVSKELIEAILYSIRVGGKRLRPLIFLELLEGLGIGLTIAHYQVAAALEMIHTGSLIHDDLPAMDNDDYRRGHLTNHKKFDEATAILAGDSLFLDPFGLIASADLSDAVKVKLIELLSFASGTYGMVGGQMLDMKAEGKQLELTDLEIIHRNKTGQLLCFPFIAAALVAECSSDVTEQFAKMGELIGLAFQIRDDILDITATFDDLGKTPQKDLVAQKMTYPNLLGLEKSYVVLEESLTAVLAICDILEETIVFNSASIQKVIKGLQLDA